MVVVEAAGQVAAGSEDIRQPAALNLYWHLQKLLLTHSQQIGAK